MSDSVVVVGASYIVLRENTIGQIYGFSQYLLDRQPVKRRPINTICVTYSWLILIHNNNNNNWIEKSPTLQ